MIRAAGVANVEVGSYGTKYILTYDDDPRVVAGSVELTALTANRIYSVRDRFGEPIAAGSPRYGQFTAAVRKYEDWAGRH